MKEYYTITDTAKELNTTYRTVSRWIKDGVIEGTRPGENWQITAEEVERIKSVKAYEKRGRKKDGKRKK